jgi:hypothetical protein
LRLILPTFVFTADSDQLGKRALLD